MKVQIYSVSTESESYSFDFWGIKNRNFVEQNLDVFKLFMSSGITGRPTVSKMESPQQYQHIL